MADKKMYKEMFNNDRKFGREKPFFFK